MPAEIRLKPVKLLPKSFLDTLLTLVVATIIIIGYLQLPTTPTPPYESEFAQLETTGQLLLVDESLNSNRFEQATVSEIVDGDTIKITRADNSVATVRYIGIDTPEITHQGNGIDEPYGQIATQVNTWLVLNKTVYLQKDATDTDRYGRLLRYVYLEDGVMVNYVLVRLGYASIMTIPPNVAFQQKFYAAQELARTEKRNLFADN